MGSFVRGATDTLIGSVRGDIRDSSNIEMWINTFNETFRRNKEDFSFISVVNGETHIGYQLTQEESLSCCEDYISLQVRWTDSGGNVGATKRKLIAVDSAEWDSIIPTTPSADTYDDDIIGIERITEPEISTMIRTEDAR